MALAAVQIHATDKQLRQFGYAGLIIFGALGAWALVYQTLLGYGLGESYMIVGGLLVALSACCGLGAIAWPKAVRPIYIVMALVAFPIGFVISHVVLALVYYLVFTPIGLIMRLLGKDLMHRKIDPDANTYWTEHPQTTDMRRYHRQY